MVDMAAPVGMVDMAAPVDMAVSVGMVDMAVPEDMAAWMARMGTSPAAGT